MTLTRLISIAVIALTAIAAALWLWPQGETYEKELSLTFVANGVVPAAAHTKSGASFSGVAYGTFGDGRLDCTEWKGPFEGGKPHGQFVIYRSCNEELGRYVYRYGVRQ